MNAWNYTNTLLYASMMWRVINQKNSTALPLLYFAQSG